MTLIHFFLKLEQNFERIPKSHILRPISEVPNLAIMDLLPENFNFYSAYGVYFPKEFSINAHKDYQCSLCNGEFKAIMVPRYLNPNMAQVCSEESCQDAYLKGYYFVDVCKEHWTKQGTIDRIQINMYFTNSTRCFPLGNFDEFDCEALSFQSVDDFRHICTTQHPFLLPLIEQRDAHWVDVN
eukprot:TRINITY_DN6033_c0_g1_i1.p1 TRINITY_DN6033_c0_g1~~TRINITY_DN6033_c0_g1_i1.p1  ORF type:complete len:183 (+),score=24.55 TRINITY_DN6033_c0_g1_i1:116-664(+)